MSQIIENEEKLTKKDFTTVNTSIKINKKGKKSRDERTTFY